MAVNDEIFGKRLSYEMKKQKITVTELSERTKIAESIIKRMMTGHPTAKTDRHQRIANALGVSSGFLVGEHDDKHGAVMTGRRLCLKCGKDMEGRELYCPECKTPKKRKKDEGTDFFGSKRYDHLPGTMREAVEIERQARLCGMHYGHYAPIFDGRK